EDTSNNYIFSYNFSHQDLDQIYIKDGKYTTDLDNFIISSIRGECGIITSLQNDKEITMILLCYRAINNVIDDEKDLIMGQDKEGLDIDGLNTEDLDDFIHTYGNHEGMLTIDYEYIE